MPKDEIFLSAKSISSKKTIYGYYKISKFFKFFQKTYFFPKNFRRNVMNELTEKGFSVKKLKSRKTENRTEITFCLIEDPNIFDDYNKYNEKIEQLNHNSRYKICERDLYKSIFNDKNKKKILGQYFTKPIIAKYLVSKFSEYVGIKNDDKILEPSSGSGSFVDAIKEISPNCYLKYCEIDPSYVSDPADFFKLSTRNKFNIIIGNPPFTKYNIKDSYFYQKNHNVFEEYMLGFEKQEKIHIENAFILKSIKHIRENGSIGFVLPISWLIKSKHSLVKSVILKEFSSIYIIQNNEKWIFDNIPCCFVIFSKSVKDNKIHMEYCDRKIELPISDLLNKELVPSSFFFKLDNINNNNLGNVQVNKFLSDKKITIQKSYNNNNISASNILNNTNIKNKKLVKKYVLAVTRVGNSSVGKCGLVNMDDDILNDMFYVFSFNESYNDNYKVKEFVCSEINKNRNYFSNITHRVGSKSIKKSDVLKLFINDFKEIK